MICNTIIDPKIFENLNDDISFFKQPNLFLILDSEKKIKNQIIKNFEAPEVNKNSQIYCEELFKNASEKTYTTEFKFENFDKFCQSCEEANIPLNLIIKDKINSPEILQKLIDYREESDEIRTTNEKDLKKFLKRIYNCFWSSEKIYIIARELLSMIRPAPRHTNKRETNVEITKESAKKIFNTLNSFKKKGHKRKIIIITGIYNHHRDKEFETPSGEKMKELSKRRKDEYIQELKSIFRDFEDDLDIKYILREWKKADPTSQDTAHGRIISSDLHCCETEYQPFELYEKGFKGGNLYIKAQTSINFRTGKASFLRRITGI